MRAITVAEHGGPEVLRLTERDRPEAGPGQVLVEVAAAGVNFIDTYQRSGAYPMDLPYVIGSEGAGTVVQVGPDSADVAVGDRVAWAMVPGSGGSEYAVLPCEKVVPVPTGVTLETAAAVMLQGMTAHYLVESTYPAQSGQTALVHAAAGGVGLLLCQLLARKGVRVIGTTSTQEKAERARAAGADAVVRYRSAGGNGAGDGQEKGVDLVAEVRRLTDDRGVDVVYDGVGKATFDAGLTVLRARGMMVLFGAASGPVPPLDPQALNTAGSVFLTRPSLAHYLQDREELLWRSSEVLGAVAAGELAVSIGATYGLDEAADAHRDLESGGTSGKLLLVL
jgi:NADPH2:quinone reductase